MNSCFLKRKLLLLMSSVLVISSLSTAAFATGVSESESPKQNIIDVKAREKIYDVGEYQDVGSFLFDYFNSIFKVMETGNISNFEQSVWDTNTYMILKDFEYASNFYKVFHGGVHDVSLDQFIIKEVQEINDYLSVTVYVNFSYIFNKSERNAEGSLYKVKMKNGNPYEVTSIDKTSIDIQLIKDTLKVKLKNKKQVNSASTTQTDVQSEELKVIDEIYNERNYSLETEKKKADKAAKSSIKPKNKTNTIENNSIVSPSSVTVSYGASEAGHYGFWFGDHYQNYIFKRATLDCTNFVSQCIWNGYGGSSGYNIEVIGYDSSYYYNSTVQALRQRVANNYRQTSKWYGRNYDSPYGNPISSFCGVPSLWDFATNNTGTGPKATGYNNGKVYTDLSTPMKRGDILQFFNPSTSTWYHSVVVVTCTDYYVSDYTQVRVAQHQDEHFLRPLDQLVQIFGGSTCKMRLLRPKTTTF